MDEQTHLAEHMEATTCAEAYGDNVLITTIDHRGRQLAQVLIQAEDAGELPDILGSKLNTSRD
jgi:hypothetical protein